jgi:hypothetical protein
MGGGRRCWTSVVLLVSLIQVGIGGRIAWGQEDAAGGAGPRERGAAAQPSYERVADRTEPSPMPRLTLRILVESPSGGPWLRTAEGVFDELFTGAGIGVDRVYCGEVKRGYCGAVPTGNEFVVRVQGRRLDTSSYSCGVSLRPWAGTGHFVTVYRDCLQAASRQLSVPEGVLAAYTIAHEVGHLLLPIGHASRGIMRARPDRADWRKAASGTLRFSEEEARQMRAALQARTQPD